MTNEPIIKNKPKKNNKRNRNLLIYVIIILTLIILIPYFIFIRKEDTYTLQQFKYTEVGLRDFVNSIPASGTVISHDKKELTISAKGEIVAIYKKAGDVVKEGELIVKINYTGLKEDLDDICTEYKNKLIEIQQQQLEYDRDIAKLEEKIKDKIEECQDLKDKMDTWEELYKLGALSKNELEAKRDEIEDAENIINDYRQEKKYLIKAHQFEINNSEQLINDYEEEISKLEDIVSKTEIKAPFSGRVVEFFVKPGHVLNEGEKVATIIKENSLMIEAKIALHEIDFVEEGQTVYIYSGGKTYQGEVNNIASVADGSQVEVMINFIDKVNLRLQTDVSLDIVLNIIEDELSLPRGRYLTSGQETFVYKIDGEKAIKTRVNFGLVNGDYIQIKEGLNKGDRVITSSYDSFIQYEEIDVNLQGGIKHD